MVIGGGTGSFTVLSALKHVTSHLTALVTMADDGGSTGKLRDELGVLPPGDVRQCLVALSDSPKIRDLFTYRFEEGTLAGHSFGNLLLTALEKLTGSFAEAVETASEILNVTGKVVPITLDNVRLILKAGDGFEIHGEHRIDTLRFGESARRPELCLEPDATLNPDARAAIIQADLVVIAPGDIYTSLGPLLIVEGVGQALADCKARVAYVCNLVVKPGQTTGFSVADHADEIERFAGAPILDYVLYNTAEPDQELLSRYTRDEEFLVSVPADHFRHAHYKAIGRPLISPVGDTMKQHDVLASHRSLIRHDTYALTQAIIKLL